MRRRGFTVAPMLALVMVALSIAFVLVGMATFQMNASRGAETREQALYLAEGALSQTLSKLHDGLQAVVQGGQQFGLHKEKVTFAPYPERPDAIGEVSFDPATRWGYSTNNFDGKQNVGADRVPVPEGMVHLIARGVYGASIRTVEAFVNVPPYSFALACDGPINSVPEPIQVRAEASMQALYNNNQSGTPDTTSPANLGSNVSIKGGANCLITGDAVSPGSVTLGAGSQVDGAVRRHSVTVPQIDVQAYDLSGLDNIPVLSANPPNTDNGTTLVLFSPTLAPQPVTTINGNLQLINVILYAKGKLVINGGVTGTGAICAEGDVTIQGGADLDATSQIALVSGGSVTLQGSSASKFFQGLVYCQGAFSAQDITVAGALMVAQPPGAAPCAPPPSLTLGPNTHVVYIPSANNATLVGDLSPLRHSSAYALPTPPPPAAPTSIMTTVGPNVSFNTMLYNTATVLNPTLNSFTPSAVSANTLNDVHEVKAVEAALQGDPAAKYLFPNRYPYSVTLDDAYQWEVSPVAVLQTLDVTEINLDSAVLEGTPFHHQVSEPNGQWSMVGRPNYIGCIGITYNQYTQRFEKLTPPMTCFQAPSTGAGTFRQFVMSQSAVDAQIAHLGITSAQIVQTLLRAQYAYMDEANKLLSAQPPNSPQYTLNQFLSDTSPLHVVSWREK